ncbi:MAG: HTH domain-containing protein [Fusobacteria bacterium]|nr:HTH domain-containing protein [Fusobacteriota bacterium]
MEIKNIVEVTVMLGYYKNLLSEKQQVYLEVYLEEDYSLSEIAKEYKVSRQAVYDQIKKAVLQLYEIESKLKFVKRDEQLKRAIENLEISVIEREKLLELI